MYVAIVICVVSVSSCCMGVFRACGEGWMLSV